MLAAIQRTFYRPASTLPPNVLDNIPDGMSAASRLRRGLVVRFRGVLGEMRHFDLAHFTIAFPSSRSSSVCGVLTMRLIITLQSTRHAINPTMAKIQHDKTVIVIISRLGGNPFPLPSR